VSVWGKSHGLVWGLVWGGVGIPWTEPFCTITAGVTMAANSISTGIAMTANAISTNITMTETEITTNIGMGCGNQG
jgi:hypothetical protein